LPGAFLEYTYQPDAVDPRAMQQRVLENIINWMKIIEGGEYNVFLSQCGCKVIE